MEHYSSYKNCEANINIVTNTVFVQVDGSFQISASTEVMLLSSAALTVTQNTDKTVAREGQYLTYHINVINNGPSNATGVVLKDILPLGADLAFVNVSTGTYSCVKNVVIWNIENLNHNNSSFADITIIPQKHGILSNYVVASENEFNPSPHYFSIINTKVESPLLLPILLILLLALIINTIVKSPPY